MLSRLGTALSKFLPSLSARLPEKHQNPSQKKDQKDPPSKEETKVQPQSLAQETKIESPVTTTLDTVQTPAELGVTKTILEMLKRVTALSSKTPKVEAHSKYERAVLKGKSSQRVRKGVMFDLKNDE